MPVWNKETFDRYYFTNGWEYGIIGKNYRPAFRYNWYGMKSFVKTHVSFYLDLPGFQSVSDVAIVGGGYGWTCEVLSEFGINSVSIDVSPHIINTYNTSEEGDLRSYLIELGFDPDLGDGVVYISPDDPNAGCNPWDYWLRQDGVRTSANILDNDLSTNGQRRSVRQALGNNIDAILTEYALDSSDEGDDTSPLVLAERCEQLRPNPSCSVVHIIVGNAVPGSGLNTKTVSEWSSFLAANGFSDHIVVSG